eukprot:2543695-Pyramimonas_sp.AAC.1
MRGRGGGGIGMVISNSYMAVSSEIARCLDTAAFSAALRASGAGLLLMRSRLRATRPPGRGGLGGEGRGGGGGEEERGGDIAGAKAVAFETQ